VVRAQCATLGEVVPGIWLMDRWRFPLLCVAILAVSLRTSTGQGAPLPDSQVPPGLRQWIGRDNCGEPRWVAFHNGLAEVVGRFNRFEFGPALGGLVALLVPVVQDPHVAFDCSTAVSSAFGLAAQCAEQLQLPVLSARLRQLVAIFGSFDYQMKGEEYIDQSPWPVRWMDSMDGILRSMTMLKRHEVQVDPSRGFPVRQALAQSSSGGSGSGGGKRIAIVSVCDYDAGATPLARLSQINKQAYAQKHGYDVFVYEKSPYFEDPLAKLFVEPPSYRPAAWSKVDAILLALAEGKHDWVMWMDCDSFFMDPEVRLEDVAAAAEAEQCGAFNAAEKDDVTELQGLVKRWMDGPAGDLGWFEDLLDAQLERDGGSDGCGGPQELFGEPPRNRTLGLGDWLFQQRRPHVIASEDGLMLNTGIVLVRASAWSWRFFQQVRWMTFGRSPVTQHPWWEQTAMVYLLQLPFTLAHASGVAASAASQDIGPTALHKGYASACFMFSQKHLNGYPPIVSSALKTHTTFETGDFIVSFSGCKVYSSQEVCNQLFLGYFFQVHDMRDFESDPALSLWL